MVLNNKTGSPVEGEDFFGREKELAFSWKEIEKGNSIILAAPRRVGKTSFAKKLIAAAKTNGWQTLEINLEEVRTEIGFVELFIEGLRSQDWFKNIKHKSSALISKTISSLKPSIAAGETTFSISWKSEKTNIYQQLSELLDHKKDTLIMVDELTILLSGFVKNDLEHGKQTTEEFLNWLRSFRQKSGTKIRWVFCSSVGIEYFTNLHGLSNTINDLHPHPLDAYSKEEATKMLKDLAEHSSLKLEDEVTQYALDKLDWYLPYFIQILYNKINQLIEIHGYQANKYTVNKAYNDLIQEKHLNTWDERLRECSTLDEKASRILLTAICISPKGLLRRQLLMHLQKVFMEMDQLEVFLSRILYMLKNEGYLIESNSSYTFRSPLLRDFWHHRFAK